MMVPPVAWGIGFLVAAMVTATWFLMRRRRTALRRASPPLPDAERWRRIQDIMVRALALPADDREGFVRAESGDDPALSEEVLSLLSETEREGVLDQLTEAVVQPLLSGSPVGSRRTVGHYVIEEEIGRGGMGVVHRAKDARLDRMVALKFLPPWASSDPEAKQRFLLEARAAAALDHPNVCTIHEIGETEEGLLYIAMPCYEGETLAGRLAGGALSATDAVAVAMQVGRGLAKAHERGMVHRDVKPANVMITEDGVTKVLDFGVAKLSSSKTRGTGAQPGTLAYMSPEQAAGEEVDHRTDIWALGVILYEMLSGRRPFDGRGDAALLHSILTSDPAPPGTPDQPVRADLDRILQRALARDPKERYEDIGSMVADLEECAARQVSGEASGAHRLGMAPDGAVPAEGERRTVTVLVSSIAGCLEAFERLPPEEADVALHDLSVAASHVMRSHGGIVNEVTGEELICLFGAPAAHEDDYVRAVRAALDLQEAVGRIDPFGGGLQSGIETGPVLVRPSEGDGRAFQVAGNALRTATLLSTQAQPGAVFVGPRCQRLVAPYYLTEACAPIAGLRTQARLTPHRVLGKSGFETRLEAAGPTNLSRHIGRDAEMRTLADALSAMLAGEGTAIRIVGEAGLGKSRLLYEFTRAVDATPARVITGRCRTDAADDPYGPFAAVIASVLDVEVSPTDPAFSEAMAGAVSELVPEVPHMVPLCLRLLGLTSDRHPLPRDLEAQHLRVASGEAVATLLARASDQTPLVLMLEDWHWADPASRAALGPLVALADTHPMLVLVTHRPDLELARMTEGLATLTLEPLDADKSLLLVGAMLGSQVAPAAGRTLEDVGRAIYERTGGNPFFIEELSRALIEQGTLRDEGREAAAEGGPQELDLPETVQLVIRTRLDRLEPASRDVLRTASVIGRDFNQSLLQRVCEPGVPLDVAVPRLLRAGLVQSLRLLPEPAYRFKHALTQEVAYGSLAAHARRTLHRRVAEALRADSGATPALLCHHFAGAEEWAEAVHYARAAAERMSVLSDPVAAKLRLEQAIAWLERLPATRDRERTRVELLLAAERCAFQVGLRDEQRRMLRNVVELLEADGDAATLAEAYVRSGDLHAVIDQYDTADEFLSKALRIGRRIGSAEVMASARRGLAFLRWHQGRSEEARLLLEQVIEAGSPGAGDSVRVSDVVNMATLTSKLGDHETASDFIGQALKMCDELGLPVMRVTGMLQLATVHKNAGDHERAFEILAEVRSEAEAMGLPALTAWAGQNIAHTQFGMGDKEGCVATYDFILEEARRSGSNLILATALRGRATALFEMGRFQEAAEPFREAVKLLEQAERYPESGQVRQLLALSLEQAGALAEALEEWRRLAEGGQPGTTRFTTLAALEGMGRMNRALGSATEDVVGSLEAALALAEELGDPEREGAILNTLGIVAFENGSFEEARDHFSAGLRTFERSERDGHAAQMRSCVAACEAMLGHVENAIELYQDAIEGHRVSGEALLEAKALSGMGDAYRGAQKLDRAASCYRESLRIRRRIGDRAGQGWMLAALASLGPLDGEPDQAERCLEEAHAIAVACADTELLSELAARGDSPMTS